MPFTTFVLGGAASGKSEWAEKHIGNMGLRQVYVATGQIFDAEVKKRVKVHKARRSDKWQTVEAPFDLAPAFAGFDAQTAFLVDCATMWLSNHLLQKSDLKAAQEALVNAITTCPGPVLVVSNEVGHGIVPDNALARQFREAQGRLNMALAARAETVVKVTAGLPQVLKGAVT